MNLFNKIKQRWRDYRHQRYLQKMGWSEAAYQRYTDPRVFHRAQTVDSFYHGYNYLHLYENSRMGPFTNRDWVEVRQEIDDWCGANLTGAWRNDLHRVYEQHAIDVNGDDHRELWINDLGGMDVLAYAFENEQDHSLSRLASVWRELAS